MLPHISFTFFSRVQYTEERLPLYLCGGGNSSMTWDPFMLSLQHNHTSSSYLDGVWGVQQPSGEAWSHLTVYHLWQPINTCLTFFKFWFRGRGEQLGRGADDTVPFALSLQNNRDRRDWRLYKRHMNHLWQGSSSLDVTTMNYLPLYGPRSISQSLSCGPKLTRWFPMLLHPNMSCITWCCQLRQHSSQSSYV